MITEDYVSFEIAKLLKENDFDEKCRTYYKVFPESRIAAIYHSSENRGVSEDDPNEILCPTLQMTMKWLRKVHKIFIEPKMSKNTFLWGYRVSISNGSTVCFHTNIFNECEEACEAAIKYCLENLI